MQTKSHKIGSICKDSASVLLNLNSLYQLTRFTLSVNFINQSSQDIFIVNDQENGEIFMQQSECGLELQNSIISFASRIDQQQSQSKVFSEKYIRNAYRNSTFLANFQEQSNQISLKSSENQVQARKIPKIQVYIPIQGLSFKKILKNQILLALLQLSNAIVVPQNIQYRVYIESCLQKSGINVQNTSHWKKSKSRLKIADKQVYYQISYNFSIQIQGKDLSDILSSASSVNGRHGQKKEDFAYFFRNLQKIKVQNAYRLVKKILSQSFDSIYLNSEENISKKYEQLMGKSRKLYEALVCSKRFASGISLISFSKIKQEFDTKILNHKTKTLQDEQIEEIFGQQIEINFQKELRILKSHSIETYQQKSLEFVKKLLPSNDKSHVIFQILIKNLIEKIKEQHQIKNKKLLQLQQEIKKMKLKESESSKPSIYKNKNILRRDDSIRSLRELNFSLKKNQSKKMIKQQKTLIQTKASNQNTLNNDKQNLAGYKGQSQNNAKINFKKTQLSQVQETPRTTVLHDNNASDYKYYKDSSRNTHVDTNSESKKDNGSKQSAKPKSSAKTKRWQ